MTLKPNSQASLILAAIRDAHARNVEEIHIETGVSRRNASALLCQLEKGGFIRCVGTYPRLAGDEGSALKMYEPTQEAA